VADHVWTETVTIDAPPPQVWRVLLDVHAWPTWTRSMRSVTVLNSDPLRTGAVVRISQPRLPVTHWTVDELFPGQSFAWTSRRPGVRTVAEHHVEPHADGSAVTLVLRQSGPLAGVSARMFGQLIRRYLQMEANGLKWRVEPPTTG
jgi:uncharacterized membrane protein